MIFPKDPSPEHVMTRPEPTLEANPWKHSGHRCAMHEAMRSTLERWAIEVDGVDELFVEF